jgi:hypothetical protein
MSAPSARMMLPHRQILRKLRFPMTDDSWIERHPSFSGESLDQMDP